MNLIIWVYLGLATWPTVFAIYYLEKKEIFQLPKDRRLSNNSYFGYSITYAKFNKKLVISSPRENNIGEVYSCSIENRFCAPINTTNIVNRVSSNYTHDYWFGATVKAGSNFVTICAPRYTAYVELKQTYGTYGKCYSYNALGHLEERRQIPYNITTNSVIEKTMDSFGWSIDVTSRDNIIVGGPGMNHGRAMIYEQPDIRKVPKLFEIEEKYSSHAPELNLGYAVASGMFINKDLSYAISSPYGAKGHGKVLFYNRREEKFMDKYIEDTSHIGSMFGGVLCAAKLSGSRTDLLVGAPTYATKDAYNVGAVYVYLARKNAKAPDFHKIIVGKVSGAMFGSAIISVGDLNGDKKDEIAIGAPFEKDGHGVVYLYSGAVLYNDIPERHLKYLQRIEAERSYGESFGMSLAPLLDYDNNGCKELAIGSPYKDTVVLLRCMAAVKVQLLKPKFPNIQIRNSSQFDFEVCLSVKYPTLPRKIIAGKIKSDRWLISHFHLTAVDKWTNYNVYICKASYEHFSTFRLSVHLRLRVLRLRTLRFLSTTVKIEHVSAKLLNTNGTGLFTYETSLDKKEPKYCKKISLFLPKDGEYESKISYTISSKLLNNPVTMPDFNISRVILSDLSVLTQQDSLWAAECTGNETCTPDLSLTPFLSFYQDNDPYIIGTTDTESINMTVHNIGDIAYESCVRVHFIGVNVFKTPIGCKYENLADTNKLLCEPPNPIRTNKTWSTGQIELEMKQLTSLDRNIIINMLLFNHCEEVVTKNTSITIPLKADPRGIRIIGETDIGSIVDMTKQDAEENGKNIQHIYTITNKGQTNWKNLEAFVNLQTKPYIKYGDISVSVHYATSNVYSACLFVSQNEASVSYSCLIKSLVKSKESANIVIPMYIVPGTLDGTLEKDKNVTIISSVNLKLIDDHSQVESIITTIMLQEAIPVSKETIIIAVVVGICIIVIIVLILYWVGFLRRKKREELEKLIKDVKRQTILKRSTMQMPQATDQTEILNSIQEENTNDHTQDLKEA